MTIASQEMKPQKSLVKKPSKRQRELKKRKLSKPKSKPVKGKRLSKKKLSKDIRTETKKHATLSTDAKDKPVHISPAEAKGKTKVASKQSKDIGPAKKTIIINKKSKRKYVTVNVASSIKTAKKSTGANEVKEVYNAVPTPSTLTEPTKIEMEPDKNWKALSQVTV